jgi:hypothetical protein
MNDELEAEAIAVVRQYGFALSMAKPVKSLLLKIAARLEWHHLLGELKK